MTSGATTTKWIWDKYGKDVADGFLSFAKRWYQERERSSPKLQSITRKWMKFNWSNAAERYQQHIQELCGQLIVPGIGSVELDDLFTDVFIIEKPAINQWANYQRGEEPKFDESKRISGLRLLTQDRGHRLFIWGEPGAGKTTFLKHVVQRAAQNNIQKIPIFVSLTEWEISQKELLTFIAEQFEICDFPNAAPFIEFILREGDAILLFDGLDEVTVENREKFAKILNTFSRKATITKSQTLITCRIGAISYTQEDFTNVQIASFDQSRIQSFIYKRLHNPEKAKKFLDELQKPENVHLTKFSENPLLLSLMCMVFEPNQELPKRRVVLYREATRYLLSDWNREKGIEKNDLAELLTSSQVEQLYSEIAAQTFEEGKLSFEEHYIEGLIKKSIEEILGTDVMKTLEIGGMLKALVTEHGIITRRGKRIYSFSHPTFQEYFTAQFIAENPKNFNNTLKKYGNNDRWREIYLLAVSVPDEADGLLNIMCSTAAQFLRADPVLLEIQRRIQRKATPVPGLNIGTIRSIYWFLTLVHNMALAYKVAVVTPHLDYEYIFDIANILRNLNEISDINGAEFHGVIELAYHFSREYGGENYSKGLTFQDYPGTYEIILDSALIYTSMLINIFADKETTRVRSFDILLNSPETTYPVFIDLIFKPIEFIQEGDPFFRQALSSLSIPSLNAKEVEWKKFQTDYHEILREFRDIGYEWHLTIVQIEQIKQFLLTNFNIMECLKVANVRDREAILSKILTVD